MKTLLIILSIGFIGCSNNVTEKNIVTPDFTHQLYHVKGGWQYQIIEFKDHEYIATGHGGIIHAESCNCKNH